MLEANKRLYVLFISMIAVISILVLSSSKSHSLEDLQMKVQYKTDQGTVETWNLEDDYEFEQEWFTKKDSVTFTVDLSNYYEEGFGEEAPPFEVKARHHQENVKNIKVKQKSPFTGVYDVSFKLVKNSEGSVKDGKVNISIDIEEENAWKIPSGHNPITFDIKRDTTSPEVSVNGVEDEELFVPDRDKKPQYPVFKIDVIDRHIDLEKVFAIVDEDKIQLKKKKGADNTFVFDEISEDGIYEVQFSASDRNGNTTTTDKMTIYVHNDTPTMDVDVDGEKVDPQEPILNNKATKLALAFKNIIPIEDIEVEVLKDGKEYKLTKNDLEVNEYTGKWTYTFKKEGKYEIKPTVKDSHNGSEFKHQFDAIELEISKNKPIIELDGIEHGKIYHSDKKLKVKIKDRKPSLNITYVTVNGKRNYLDVNKEGNAEFTFDKDGKYVISVSSTNLFFNETTTEEMTFFVHQDEIDEQVVVNGEEIKERTFFYHKDANLQMKLGSTISIDDVQFDVEKNGETYQTSSPEINDQEVVWNDEFTEEGVYTVNVKVTDKNDVGETYTHSLEPIEFTIDKTKPVISILEDEDNKVQDDITQGKRISVEVTEKNFNKDQAKITVLNEDNKAVDIQFSDWKAKSGAKDTYIASYEFEKDGNYKVLVEVEDNATNKASKQTALFAIDQTKATYEVSGIEDQAHYKQKRQVDVVIQDEHLDPSNTSIAVEKWNDIKETYESFDVGEIDYADKKAAKLSYLFKEDATYRLTLSATDLAGNILKPVVYEFTIDTIAPEVHVKNIKNDTFYNEPREVEFSVKERNYKQNNVHFKITQDGKDITKQVESKTGSEWKQASEHAVLSYMFEEDGEYEILFKAIDHAGNASKEYEWTFTIDQTNPVIDIDGVEDGDHYAQTKEVQIDITDRNLTDQTIHVTKNGKEYDAGEVAIEENENNDIVASLNHSFSQEGEYEIAVKASDAISNQSTETIAFVIDKTAPSIDIDDSIRSHLTKDVINQKGINEFIDINLKELYVSTKKVEVSHIHLNGQKESIAEDEAGKWVEISQDEYTFELNEEAFQQDGKYTITVNAQDKAGTKAKEQSISFVVDNIKPEITLSSIKRYNDKAVTQKITVEEYNFKQNNVNVEVFRENSKGKFILVDDVKKWENKAKQTSLVLPFAEDGTYKVVVNATDNAGNKAVEQSNLFTVDTIKPTINISGIEMTSEIKHYNTNKPVKVEINDKNINEATTKVEIQKLNRNTGKMEPYKKHAPIKITRKTALFSHDFTTKDEGLYRMKVSAGDKSGNRAANQEVTFVIDKTPPKLAINGVENNAYYDTNKRVSVSINETNFATNDVTFSVLRNGQDITNQVEKKQGSKWRTQSRLSTLDYEFTTDGFYEIKIGARDAAGNIAQSKNVQFTIDKTNPVIDITGVDNDEHYNVDKTVNVVIRDVNLKVNNIRVTRNGNPYDVGGFSIDSNQYADSFANLRHTFKAEGKYDIVVDAVDQAGNSATEQISFTIDKTPPVITPVMKEDGTVLKDGQYINKVFTPQFQLDEADDKIVSVTLNGGENIANKIPMASKEMFYKYNVLARDKAGNETTHQISFTVDVTKPTINITGIVDGFFNDDVTPVVMYADKHLDESKSSVTLNGQPYTNGTLLSEERDYVLKAKITDLANNVTERTIVFTIDKTAPVIKFENELSGQYFNESIIPEIFIEDMIDYDIISLTLNGEPYTIGDPIEEEGKHVLYFEVKDNADNIKQLTVEFMIDKTPPNVLISGVEHNEEYLDPREVSIQLDNPDDTIKEITVNGEVYEGEVIEKDGQQLMILNFEEIGAYDIQVHAYDDAGNETIEQLNFEIIDKTILNMLVNNKPLLFGSIIGSTLLALLFILLALRKSKNKAASEDSAA